MASRKIQFVFPRNGVHERQIHLLHHKDLVLGTILGALEVSHQSEAELPEITQWLDQWSVDELMKFGVVSLYHLWERQTKKLCLEQLGTPALPKRKGRADEVTYLLQVLEDELSAPTNARARAALHACRALANAIKHDTGATYEQLAQSHPAYFLPGQGPALERFRITPQMLGLLFDELVEFWGSMPHDPGHSAAHRRRGPGGPSQT